MRLGAQLRDADSDVTPPRMVVAAVDIPCAAPIYVLFAIERCAVDVIDAALAAQ